MLQRSVESAQYVSIRYSERLAEAGIEPSVGSKGDSYDTQSFAGALRRLFIVTRSDPLRKGDCL